MNRAELQQLVRFLLDRIGEDEATIAKLARSESRGGEPATESDALDGTQRLLAESIAKRHVIGDLQQLFVFRDLPIEQPIREVAVNGLLHMATPYRHHVAYQSHWPAPTDTLPTRPVEGAHLPVL